MKFKVIFLLFNAVLIVSFLVIYLMPLFIIGWDYTKLFWAGNWYLPVVFFSIIGALNVYFALNWRLFLLLEKEDWRGLVSYLEDQVLSKKRFRRQYLRILVNGYLVNSDTDAILRLEQFVRDHKPRVLDSLVVLFGVPHLLKNDPLDMERYFAEFRERATGANARWVSWNYAFALMLQKRRDEARPQLLAIAADSRQPVLLLLSLYLLDAFSDGDTSAERALERGKNALKKRFTPASWQKELERSKENVEVVILAKLVQEATEWLFSFGAVEDPKRIH